MKKKIAVFAVIAAVCVAPALAIFGLGDIVFDPTNFEEAAQQLLQLEQQYAQLVQTYQMVRSQYEQMIWMGQQVPVNMALRYRALATPWQTSSATNTYGTTAGWVGGINTGVGVSAGYAGPRSRWAPTDQPLEISRPINRIASKRPMPPSNSRTAPTWRAWQPSASFAATRRR